VARYARFAHDCPRLLPGAIRSAAFIDQFEREVVLFLEHEQAIKRFLQSDPRLIALCHWNAQIDNAWFWRDGRGSLQCGLMDWGHVGQMNVAFALWGCLSGTLQSIWDRDLEGLLDLFIQEFNRHGGPRLTLQELRLHLQLYIAVMGLSYFVASPARILAACPDATAATGPDDPMLRNAETARNNLHILGIFLNVWRTHRLGAVLQECLPQLR
jgi:hypothetical protein